MQEAKRKKGQTEAGERSGRTATSVWTLLADLECNLKSNKKGLTWNKEAAKPLSEVSLGLPPL